jgi:hypothetical protein
VEASPFYRGGRVVQGGDGWQVMEGELSIVNGQLLLGMGEAGWLRKGGVMKVGLTVGQFAMARRWAACRRGNATCGEGGGAQAGLWRKKGGVNLGWAGWAMQAAHVNYPLG